MKNLRDQLLEDNRRSVPALNKLRVAVLDQELDRCGRSPVTNFPLTLWRELLAPYRTAWAALCVVWILLALISTSARPVHPSSPPTATELAEAQKAREAQELLLSALMQQGNLPSAPTAWK